jgi:hypothetical protein
MVNNVTDINKHSMVGAVKCKKNLVNGQVNNELMYFVLYNTCNMIEYLSARKQHILITRHK